eukprot:sb/3475872/
MVRSSLEYEVDVPTDTPAAHKGEEHGEQINVAIHKTTEQSNTCSYGYVKKLTKPCTIPLTLSSRYTARPIPSPAPTLQPQLLYILSLLPLPPKDTAQTLSMGILQETTGVQGAVLVLTNPRQ